MKTTETQYQIALIELEFIFNNNLDEEHAEEIDRLAKIINDYDTHEFRKLFRNIRRKKSKMRAISYRVKLLL